ncbi:hypothetical protein ACTGWZ_02870 [Streptococcus suis]
MRYKRVRAEIKINGETVAKTEYPKGLTVEKKAKIKFDVLMGRYSLESIKK